MQEMKSLDELAIKHGTDKSSLGHNYMSLYEKHLPKKINKLCEIGVWHGEGIKTFKEYYNNEGEFYALDRFLEGHGLITTSELSQKGIKSLKGDHDDFTFLKSIKEKFTVIIDDGSHHWKSQINIFRIMFQNNLENNGIYICEDIFDDLYWGQGLIKTKEENIKGLLTKYKSKKNLTSDYITEQENNALILMIDEVFIYDNIVFITKQ